MRKSLSRKFPGASSYTDRHGKKRWRYRKGGFSAELGCEFGSTDFVSRYEAATAGKRTDVGAGKTIPKSISDLVTKYYQSSDYLELADSTKKAYRGTLENFREKYGSKSAIALKKRHIKAILASMADRPAAANNLLKRIKSLMNLAIDLEWRADNPAFNVKPFKATSTGFHTWTEGEIERFYATHAVGTVAHTAMTLMLYTGAARADVVRLGRQNLASGRLRYRRQKTIRTNGLLIDIPVHPELGKVIKALPSNRLTFLETDYGECRSATGFGNLMRKWCDEANLPNCTSHGLRKAIARRMAEAGATPHEIMAVTGHKSLKDVMLYTSEFNRGSLADLAIGRL